MNLFIKQSCRFRKQTYGYQRGNVAGRDKLEAWRCFVSTLRGGIGRVGGRRKRKEIWLIHCYKAETNTPL